MAPTPARATAWTLLGLLVLSHALPAAAVPRFLGSHRDWNVYVYNDQDQQLCYIASEPTKEEGNYTRRGAAAVLVTRVPGGEPIQQVSVQPGYSYLPDSEVELTIDQTSFRLFTQGQHAWAKSEADDRAIIEAMKRGVNMTVRGTSTRNTFSLDTYSLLGFTAAYQAMVAACRNS